MKEGHIRNKRVNSKFKMDTTLIVHKNGTTTLIVKGNFARCPSCGRAYSDIDAFEYLFDDGKPTCIRCGHQFKVKVD